MMKQEIRTQFDQTLWVWQCVWFFFLTLFLGMSAVYLWLPLDGAAGDTSSFSPDGFLIQWLLEERPSGLREGDVIIRMDGHTVEEWLRGEPLGPKGRVGGIVTYEVLRESQPLELQIKLAPVAFRAVLDRWAPQLLIVLCFFVIGSVIFWMRPFEPAARWQMLFCVLLALQYWIDGYNIQPGTLLWGWPFWFHLALENFSWFLAYASLLMFSLVFPQPNMLIKRFPRLVTWIVLTAGIIVQLAAYLSAPTFASALSLGSRVSFFPVVVQLALAVGFSIHSGFANRDPVSRAQIKWILAGCSVPLVVAVAGYSLPLALSGRPLVSREVSMFSSVLAPLSFAAAVLRYRIFDIEFIINRGLVYGTLTALLGGIYVLIVRGLTLVAQAVVATSNETLIIFIATMSIALAFAPLRERVQVWIDRAFYRSKVNYQRLLPELSGQLATNIILEKLTPLLSVEIPNRLQIANAELLVLDSAGQELVSPIGDRVGNQSQKGFSLPLEHPLIEHLRCTNLPLLRSQEKHLPEQATNFLEEHEIELSIPLTVGGDEDNSEPMVGLYNLGPKLSGIPYSPNELQLLTVLGKQAAISVENARLYREVENYSRTLEQQVQVRTKQLEEAKEAAEIANRAKSTFLTTMSHELRTPLNSILGYAQIVQRDPDTSTKQARGIRTIESSGRHLLSLINDVLDLSKVEAGAVDLIPTDFHFPAFLHGIGEIVRVRAERRGIDFVIRLSDALPQYVRSDERRLRQVLLNLLGNAVKFTDQGRVKLTVQRVPGNKGAGKKVNGSPLHPSTPAPMLRFEVEDSGIGISTEELKDIFDPFVQVGEGVRQYEGTGLGLAISHNLVELMGGELNVESQLGNGSRFWFELKMPIAEQGVMAEKKPVGKVWLFDSEPPKILVVDDRWENRAVFRDLLSPMGLEIHEAENGQEGLERFHEVHPALVIVDLIMPVMDGFEFIRRAKASPKQGNTPIIATSASIYEEDQKRSLLAGGDAFLPKPVNAELLMAQLGGLLELDWETIGERDLASNVEDTIDISLPKKDILETLLELATIGDIEELRDMLKTLRREDETLKPFVQKMQELAQGYRQESIIQMLQIKLQER